MNRNNIIGAAAMAATVITVAACGQPAATPRQQAVSYMQAHPQPPVTGTTTGILLTADVTGFYGAAATQAGCPAQLTAAVTPAAGDLPACAAWTATAVTPSGTTVNISCGSVTARQACPLMLQPDGYVPVAGDYVQFKLNAPVTVPSDIHLITFMAVDVPGDDPGGPMWVTTPASSPATR